MLTLVIIVVVVALLFDFVNGMNDAANSIATVVSTRVLSPWMAVAWAAFFNFAAAILFGVAVAKTIGKGVVDPSIITPWLVLAALTGAIAWSAGCTKFGLPISVSHSLIGGLAGAGVAHSGTGVLISAGLIKVAIFIVLSPLLGLVLGYLLMLAVFWIFRRSSPRRVDRLFRTGQLVSSAAFSLGHGSNDAQKTMGIIVVVLFSAGYLDHFYVPLWVILSAHGAIALGTLAGGWRVIRTMGRADRAKPVGGFCAETGGAIRLPGELPGRSGEHHHTITGAILGAADGQSSAVRWGVARRIGPDHSSAFIAGLMV